MIHLGPECFEKYLSNILNNTSALSTVPFLSGTGAVCNESNIALYDLCTLYKNK